MYYIKQSRGEPGGNTQQQVERAAFNFLTELARRAPNRLSVGPDPRLGTAGARKQMAGARPNGSF